VNASRGPASASRLLRDWASRGRYHFSTEELADELGVSLTAARSALRRLKKKGLVASPYRGFHVAVSPENQRLGCLPAEQFVPQLLERLGTPYYAGLLTAARYHGAAHQQPQVFQVVVPKNRPPIHCGLVQVSFVARHNAAAMPTGTVSTPRGFLKVAAPETTAYDLVGYPEHCGGLDNVATVLAELGEKLDPERLIEIAELSPMPWSQRLGYILDFVEHSPRRERLAAFVASRATETAPLLPSVETESTQRDDQWKLWINADLEPDL
jgi:predicted transcriptional regulator of viral defense system